MTRVQGGHEAALDIWLANYNPWERGYPPFLVAVVDAWSAWDGAKVGVRARGERVAIHAVGKSGAIVSQPGYGRSAAAQILAASYRGRGPGER